MTVLSRENSDRLLWLGRYSERVYTGLRSFAQKFDAMTGINTNESKHDFTKSYCFDESNPSSIQFGLLRAYDNAIVLRDEIGSDTFSYIQLALYEMKNAERSQAPLLQLQKVIDNIVAFWGMADDIIEDEHVRGIIKLGKRIERVDLYARMNVSNKNIRREVRRLSYRITKTGLNYDKKGLAHINALIESESINRKELIKLVENLIIE